MTGHQPVTSTSEAIIEQHQITYCGGKHLMKEWFYIEDGLTFKKLILFEIPSISIDEVNLTEKTLKVKGDTLLWKGTLARGYTYTHRRYTHY